MQPNQPRGQPQLHSGQLQRSTSEPVLPSVSHRAPVQPALSGSGPLTSPLDRDPISSYPPLSQQLVLAPSSQPAFHGAQPAFHGTQPSPLIGAAPSSQPDAYAGVHAAGAGATFCCSPMYCSFIGQALMLLGLLRVPFL